MGGWWVSAALVSALLVAPAKGAGRKVPVDGGPRDGKRVIEIARVEPVRVELPDGAVRDFGADYQARLTTLLTEGGRFIVADPETPSRAMGALSRYAWPGSTVPAARVQAVVEGLSFVTGSRGSRMFYGFEPRFRNAFNDGRGSEVNEFPLTAEGHDWFDGTFRKKGVEPFDSRAGLDLGEGLGIDILFAWLRLKYASYRAHLRIRLEIDAPCSDRAETRFLEVAGKGFFFDLAGAYEGYSAGIRFARTDAMKQAFKNASDASVGALSDALMDLPLVARVDAVLPNGEVLLGTGHGAGVRAGIRYMVLDDPTLVLEVSSSGWEGAVARVLRGNAALVRPGMLAREWGGALAAQVGPSARAVRTLVSQSLEPPGVNLPRPDFGTLAPRESRLVAFLRGLLETLVLPYRIWRYAMYDQSYHRVADGEDSGAGNVSSAAETLDAPIVAVIDTGVDYNHPAIHGSLWLNPSPQTDSLGRQDRYGWDFISGDGRPFDDAYHGTEVAGVVLSVAPRARIMPVKAFNPWGMTSSAALLESFRYAVDHGAHVILCPWATRNRSRAIEQGVAYARERGVVIVAAAGDRGEDLAVAPAFPAAYAAGYENVVTVTAVGESGRLLSRGNRRANYGAELVAVAALGERVAVAEPRNRYARVSSTAVAAALVAGTMASDPRLTVRDLEPWLDSRSRRVPELQTAVRGGRVLGSVR